MVENITVQELKSTISKRDPNLVILDVREKDEYELGTIPGSKHKPLGALLRDLRMELPNLRGKEVIAFCRSGVRASIAADFLTKAGIKAKNLTNGYMAWEQDS